ncbi:DUF1801 domain-containing protein [Mucilaginibacter psychrotolerans]|uniref:DUF1801 domain-containing protein n=1 Tax=Mucilaginibacter psychrotolerans TaxID=1524096 RepID=A0A4Y8SL61_9SPHI|nr:DUF1801 domain-containing protein [Mucilaginibacter psychrotolerans]TFF39668.1 DUF1801 domain-containing protein [Mucilaginibacter psychrotolerans]
MKSAKPKTDVLADTPGVDALMRTLDHPLKDVLQSLRQVILAADSRVGEHVKWNAPSFLYIGDMPPFNPKEYKRYIIVSNFFRKDCIRLVFPSGAKVNDTSGFLEGDYADGRRLANFYNLEDVVAKKSTLQQIISEWLSLLEN